VVAERTLEIEAVGLNYRLTPGTIRKLAQVTPVQVRLEREPGNEFDPNAVKILVTEKPWAKRHAPLHIGYVARGTASVLAPRMDSGKFPFPDVWLTDADPDTGRGTLLLRRKVKAKGKS
jgi:hypothetical protein